MLEQAKESCAMQGCRLIVRQKEAELLLRVELASNKKPVDKNCRNKRYQQAEARCVTVIIQP